MNLMSFIKLIAVLILIGPILFALYVFTGLLSFILGGETFYAVIILAAVIFFIGLTMIPSNKFINKKTYPKIIGIFVLLIGLSVAGYEGNRAYKNNFNTMSDKGVDLREYEPFKTNTKAVNLNEPISLKLTSELPKLDGATALYPLYAAFAQAVYPNSEYKAYDSEVMSSNTRNAYERLIKGEVDIIFAAQPSVQHRNDASKAGIELKLTAIGREAFVFFVHADNPVNDVTTQDIQQIYSGQITNWRDLGGKNRKIRAFQRPENSGSQTMLHKLMEGHTLTTPPKENVSGGMGDIIEQTADYRNYPNALGFSFLYFATEMINNGEIKLLTIDQVRPERAAIKNGTYPLTADFYAVTAGSTNPNVEPFIEWILSEQGQRIVEETGYTPIDPSIE